MTQEALFPSPAADPAVPADPVLEEVLIASQGWRRSAVSRLAPCRRCGALTFHAADMGLDLCAESTVDPRQLDRGLEVACLLAGRYTAELEVRPHGGGPLIYRRDVWLTRREPRERRRLWVPEHKCNNPIGYELPWEIFYPMEYSLSRSHQNDNECPF